MNIPYTHKCGLILIVYQYWIRALRRCNRLLSVQPITGALLCLMIINMLIALHKLSHLT